MRTCDWRGDRLVGLTLIDRNENKEDTTYDLYRIAVHAVRALMIGALAIDQCVTGKMHMTSLQVGEFYRYIDRALDAENGIGLGDSETIEDLTDELDDLIKLFDRARRCTEK